jgi:hypothetical protein
MLDKDRNLMITERKRYTPPERITEQHYAKVQNVAHIPLLLHLSTTQ